MRKWIDLIQESEGFEQEVKPARLPATPENVAKAKSFLMTKWIERHHERFGNIAVFKDDIPTDLSDSCEFSSMFAREVFGSKLRGNYKHQFIELPSGEMLDLNIEAKDVRRMGKKAHLHDETFWGNEEHQSALDSCRTRVSAWVEEFLRDLRQ